MNHELSNQLVHDELMLDGNAPRNLAAVAATWMKPPGRLMAESADKNMIDKYEPVAQICAAPVERGPARTYRCTWTSRRGDDRLAELREDMTRDPVFDVWAELRELARGLRPDHRVGFSGTAGDHQVVITLGMLLMRLVSETTSGRPGGRLDPVSVKECRRPHHRELRPPARYGPRPVSGADIPAAGSAGDAGAPRGDGQLGAGAHRRLMRNGNRGAQAVLIVTDEPAQRVHRGPLAQRHQDAGGEHGRLSGELRRPGK
jgi:hypothetical protein